ncbi:MAG: D-alanine--D-alanine ligase family protein [Alphaproteobacteria bacterium]
MARPIHRLLVVTGDHALPDFGKRRGRYNEEDYETHASMVQAFESFAEFRVAVLADHGRLIDTLRDDPPDLVVNFCDTGYRNEPAHELNIPAYLEMLGVAYTGAPPAAMVLAQDKAAVRLIASELGIPVPREEFLWAAEPERRITGPFPVLIKPNRADGSVGITKDAVARDAAEAARYVAWLGADMPGSDILVQDYLPGPEYGIGVIGNPETGFTVLPALEVDFSELPAGLNPILSYESKSIPDSPYFTRIRYHRARLDAAEEAALGRAATVLFTRLGLRDYGRFDFRRGADGVIRLLEANPNPAWATDGKLAFMASFAGIGYAAMLRLLLEAAIARLQRPAET